MSYDRAYYEELRPGAGLDRLVDEARDTLVAAIAHRRVPSGRAVDVGCGRGDLLARLGPRYERHGVELSEAGLGLAAARVPDAEFAAGDIQDGLPFPDGFDLVTAVNVLEHLDRPGEALAHVAAAQPAGGVFVVHLPVIGNALQARLYRGGYDSDPTHVWRPSAAVVRALVEAVGYRHEASAFAPFVPMTVFRHVPVHPAWLGVFTRR